MRKAISSLKGVLERANDSAFMSSLDDVTRHGLKSGAIQNFEFTHDQTSQIYDEAKAEKVFQTGNSFVHDAERLLASIEARND